MLFNDTEWVEAEARRLGVLAQASRSKSAMKKQTTGTDRGWPAGSQLPVAAGRSGDAGAQHHHRRDHPALPSHRADPADPGPAAGVRPTGHQMCLLVRGDTVDKGPGLVIYNFRKREDGVTATSG
jgi:hypothetical protein